MKYISQILNNQCKFLTLNEIETRFSTRMDIMEYNGIKSAIPRQWIHKVQPSDITLFEPVNDHDIFGKGKRLNITKTKGCKDKYNLLISLKCNNEYSKSEETWGNKIINNNLLWQNIYVLPYIITSETHLQSFQYCILKRYISCNDLLFKWGKRFNNSCIYCNETDTIEHSFVQCKESIDFWNIFKEWLHEISGLLINISEIDILFGLTDQKSNDIDAINFGILFGKKYIHDERKNEKRYSNNFHIFKKKFIDRLMVEKTIAIQKGKYRSFMNKWGNIAD